MSDFLNRIKNPFLDKEYRHIYADEFLNAYIATQLKFLRQQRRWTQAQLAEKADMKQPRIPVLEDVNYSSWSISTLRRFAQAFDLRLRVSFEEFGTLINDYETLEQKSLERRSFDEDPVFKESSELEINMIDATLPQMAQTVHPVEKDIMGNQRTIERFPSLMAPQNVPQHRPGRSYGIYNDSTSQNDSLLSKRAA